MADRTSRARQPGETGGSPQRAAHHLVGPALTFDLRAEIDQMRHEAAWERGDRNARTLVKQPDLRIVLTLMKGGARLRDHRAPGPISVQTLAGHIRLHVSGQTIELPAGRVLALAGSLSHEVEAVEESAFLLTIAWPDGRGVEG